MLNMSNKHLYHHPRALGEDYPATVDEESYHRELWEEIPGLYSNRMTDDEFEIFARLDGGVKLEASGHSSGLYMMLSPTESAANTCYFNDEDLFECLDDEYDYPLEIDNEYDAYMQDICQRDVWIDQDGHDCAEDTGDQDTMLTEALINARLFYDKDFRESGDLHDSGNTRNWAGELVVREAGSPQLEESDDEDMSTVSQTQSLPPIEEKSS